MNTFDPINFFLPYQIAWIKDTTRTSIAEKSRRIGFTYAEAYRSVERRISLKTDHIFASRTKETAGEFIGYCKMFAAVFGAVVEDLGEQPLFKDSDLKGYVLRFTVDGKVCRIIGLSSNPDAFRGFGGDVTLDEFAFHRDPKKVLKAANASAKIWGHTVRIISTHNGQDSVFNRLIEDYNLGKRDRTQWSLHRVTMTDAVAQGLVGKIKGAAADTEEGRAEFLKDVRNDCLDEEEWLEEFMCVPADASRTFLAADLIRTCVEVNLVVLEAFTTEWDGVEGPMYAGYDIARSKDLICIDVFRRVGDVLWEKFIFRQTDVSYPAQLALIDRLLSNRHVARLCVDAGMMGAPMTELIQQKYGRYRVEGVLLNDAMQGELALPLRQAFEDRSIRIADIPARSEALRKPKKRIVGGNVRMETPRDKEGHCDEFWAMALAVAAADMRKAPMDTSQAAEDRVLAAMEGRLVGAGVTEKFGDDQLPEGSKNAVDGEEHV